MEGVNTSTPGNFPSLWDLLCIFRSAVVLPFLRTTSIKGKGEWEREGEWEWEGGREGGRERASE